ncbi:MAG: hypothetical protein JXB62_02340 [Pirellulales bacterium]|nr:hypothetical protein [Pirellulales bacterium]
MNRLRSIWQTLRSLTAMAACWAVMGGAAWARGGPGQEESEGGGVTAWTLPYGLVILGIALGMMLVCRSARRRDRAKPEKYDAKASAKEGKK